LPCRELWSALGLKTIGLIGGMSWASSLEYYRLINEAVNKKLGGLHSAKIVMYSIDFEELVNLQSNGEWVEITNIIINAAKTLKMAGADLVLICSNTGHEGFERIVANIDIPFLHIADATGSEFASMNLKKVGLLGTKFTMERDFYKSRLNNNFGVKVIIPKENDREIIHRIIYNELCYGKIKQSSKEQSIRVINNLVDEGAEGVILGCTELPLLIKQQDSNVPLFDTTKIHALSAVNFALSGYQ
jgi:aspartate racemase